MSGALCGAKFKFFKKIRKFETLLPIRLALEIDTRLGIQLNVPGEQPTVVESGWNLLHVASLPGTTDVAIDPPSGRLDVAWTSNSEETDGKQDTMILVHSSLCRIQSNLSLCPGPVTQVSCSKAEALWRPIKFDVFDLSDGPANDAGRQRTDADG